MNIFKQKQSFNKQSSKIVIISFSENLSIIALLIPILVLTLCGKINVAIIDANTYCTNYKLKRVEIFIVFMRDLKY